jgi:hypothetical protein
MRVCGNTIMIDAFILHVIRNEVSSDFTHRIISVRGASKRSDFNQITTLVDKHH